MKKIENLEQYTEVENKITELLNFMNDATPVTDPYYLQLEACTELISEYDRIHFKVKRGNNKLKTISNENKPI